MLFWLIISPFVVILFSQTLFTTEVKNIYFGLLMIITYVASFWSALTNLYLCSKKYTFGEHELIIYDFLKLKSYTIEYTAVIDLCMGEQRFSSLNDCKFVKITTKDRKITMLSVSHTNIDKLIIFLSRKHRELFPYNYPPIILRAKK